MSSTDINSLRRENELLRSRVAELERKLARFDSRAPEDTGMSLAEREALLSEAERIAHMGSWVWDPIGGGVRWSDEMYRIWGHEPAAVTPSLELFYAGIHPEDLPGLQEASRRGLASGKSEQVEVRVVRPNGQVRHVTMNSVLLFDDRGQLRRAVGTALDTTEQRVFEERLRQAQKMEAMGRLAGGVAHDFNNLLTVILGFAEQMRTQGGSENVDGILSAAHSAAGLTRQLLAFGRRSVLDRREVDLNQELRNNLAVLAKAVGDAVHITTRLDPNLPPVLLDAGQLQQILLNLVVNARDAMPGGGSLVLETRVASGDEAPGLELLVTDSGEGMDSQTLERAFEPFFTTKPTGSGTGLGLAVVLGAVEQNGGKVSVESEVGKGTRFRLFFPAAASPAVVEDRAPATPNPVRATQSVLVVDDDEAVLAVLARQLRMNGMQVATANGLSAAVELLTKSSFDVLVLDVRMPQVSGVELARRARELHPGVPILFVTGYAGADLEGLDLAAPWALLKKPFDGRALMAAIEAL